MLGPDVDIVVGFLAKYGGGKLLDRFFKKNKKSFDYVFRKVCQRIDDHYENKILGGNSYFILSNPEIQSELQIGFSRFETLDLEFLSEYCDLTTLPIEFSSILESFLITELLEIDHFKNDLEEWLLAQQSQETNDIVKEIRGVLKSNEQSDQIYAASFFEFNSQLKQIDFSIIDNIRAGFKQSNHHSKVYSDLVSLCFKRSDFSRIRNINDLCKLAIEKYKQSEFDPLYINVDDNLNKIQFKNKKNELTAQSNGTLWPCNCLNGLISENCEIHGDSKHGNTIHRQLRNNLCIVNWSGLSFVWSAGKDYWPPSLNSFKVLEFLFSKPEIFTGIDRIIDYGCGSGVIGISLVQNYFKIESLDLVDWLFRPIVFSSINASINLNETGQQINSYISNDVESVIQNSNLSHTLVFYNHPQLPEIQTNFQDLRESTLVVDDLNLKVFLDKINLLPKVILNVSMTNIALIERYVKSHNRKLRLLKVFEDEPFRIGQAIANNDYLEFLIKTGHFRVKRNKYFPHYHDMALISIE